MDERLILDSPLGKQETDSTGALVGVVRMDSERSYAGLGDLLVECINHTSQEAWEKITAKIDYIYEGLDLALYHTPPFNTGPYKIRLMAIFRDDLRQISTLWEKVHVVR